MKNRSNLFANCEGVVPLRPRLESWMTELLSDTTMLHSICDTHGAPLNVQHDGPFHRNINNLIDCVGEFGVPFLPMFARKANKCLTYVESARDLGIGVDAASTAEVAQCVDLGVRGSRIVCTAAVKDRDLMTLCINNGVTIIIDNSDELALLEELAINPDLPVSVGLRLNGFVTDGKALYSRFGFPLAKIDAIARRINRSSNLRLDGLHFHLHGYSFEDRIAAISQTLDLLKTLERPLDKSFFVDIGGGIPMNYLEQIDQWQEWLSQLDAALAGSRPAITHRNSDLGRTKTAGQGAGSIDSYPVAQNLVQSEWVTKVLGGQSGGSTIARRLKNENVTLRCEPGRSLLDGCGITVARVTFCKEDSEGARVVGVQMNRTQSRSGFSEFAVDPLMVFGPSERREPVEGYLAGTYCTESEWLTKRMMKFPHGVRPGDLMIFPNTAGYLMHFLESRSHQFPLAKNVFLDAERGGSVRQDPVDLI
ncbi:Y4yA family PLP-dependent enzyme [Sulfitobacter sp. S190]|uniref:Y4yA family PLP-dependent enzyme n=1 Tax=Sulfitobacter sp. S190 TaxID=2867022 RepID=UPI0021A69830|nr:Y4yA family PLP-dependent enzyme [Sulfitobacter sp. S190]UWR21253.1 Y4yA family PLP-dependent enzyme [Sulfitobacter sp. S190]